METVTTALPDNAPEWVGAALVIIATIIGWLRKRKPAKPGK